jgi:hypothetical protein
MKAPKEFFEFVFARPEWFQREMITAAEVDAIYTAAVEASGLSKENAELQARGRELEGALELKRLALATIVETFAMSSGEPLILTGGEDDAI